MEALSAEKLESYRLPDQKEHLCIVRYMEQKLRSELRPIRIWGAICSVGAGAGILNLVLPESGRTLFGWGVGAVWAVVLSWGVLALNRSKYRTRYLMNEVNEGRYRVLDCTAYKVTFQGELTNCAEARIRSRDGQYCSEKFLLDFKTAQKCKNRADTALLLMKCGSRYELLESRTEER